MQTAERERLMRMMSDESAYGVATVLKCGVCIGLLALIAVIGFSARVNDAGTPVATSTTQQKTSAYDGIRAEAHRKQVFDERRARFQATTPTHLALTPDGNRGGAATDP